MPLRRITAPFAFGALALTAACADAPTSPRATPEATGEVTAARGTNFPTAAASLTPVGAPTINALAINDAGHVVGFATPADDEFARYPFAVVGSGVTRLATLTPGASGEALGINDAGVIVGNEYSDGVVFTALRWTSAAAAPTALPGGCAESYATAINDAGTVAGACDGQAAVWEGAALTMRRLGAPGECEFSSAQAINAAGDAAGTCDDRARLWLASGGYVDLETEAGAVGSVAYALNDRREVVGAIDDRAVLWRDGTATYLPNLRGKSAAGANGIDAEGRIVGTAYSKKTSGLLPVIWVDGEIGVLPSAAEPEPDGYANAIANGRVAGRADGSAAVWTLLPGAPGKK